MVFYEENVCNLAWICFPKLFRLLGIFQSTTHADNPGQPTGGHRTPHRSCTGGHDTFCGGQGWTTGGEMFLVVYKTLQNRDANLY